MVVSGLFALEELIGALRVIVGDSSAVVVELVLHLFGVVWHSFGSNAVSLFLQLTVLLTLYSLHFLAILLLLVLFVLEQLV